jgi:hypothetical protein
MIFFTDNRRWHGRHKHVIMTLMRNTIYALAFGVCTIGATAGGANADCTCRANGQTYGLGEIICLGTPGAQRSVRCEMELNISSWKAVAGSCPVALWQTPGAPGAYEQSAGDERALDAGGEIATLAHWQAAH